MNGFAATASSSDGYGTSSRSMQSRNAIHPSGKVVAASYGEDIANGFEDDGRTRSSAHVDLRDPIQVHLLTETALIDSEDYEILSEEELDDLKKQCSAITQRIANTKSNLLIQAKYRDAAISMVKLYSPTTADGKRTSWLGGSRASGEGRMREAQIEQDACDQKCEELATELFQLEKRLMEPKRKILEHTAGILQLTHKASKRRIAQQNGQSANGIPGSPESLYTYSQSRNSFDARDGIHIEDNFPGLDALDTSSRKAPLEIPPKSPIREQQSQNKEMDRLKEENTQLSHSIAEVERKLLSLNGSLRETIVKFNPEGNGGFSAPPTAQDSQPGDMLKNQMDYLEGGLVAVQAEQESYMGGRELGQRLESLNHQVRDILLAADATYALATMPTIDDIQSQLVHLEDSLHDMDSIVGHSNDRSASSSSGAESAMTEMWNMIQNGYTDIKARKEDRRRARADKGLEDDEDMSDDEGIDLAETYSALNLSSRVRWIYRQATVLKDQKSVLKRQIKQQRELNNKSDAEKDAELAHKQELLDENQELIDRAEKDAMDAQHMMSEALEDLERAREVAQNSVEAQAELHERTDRAEKHAQDAQKMLSEALQDLERTKEAANGATEAQVGLHERAELAEKHAQDAQKMLSEALEDLEQAKEAAHHSAGTQAELHERAAKTEGLETKLRQMQESLDAAETDSHSTQQRLAQVDSAIAALSTQLDEADKSRSVAEERAANFQQQLQEKQKALKAKEEEMDELNADFVALKTEVTIARAELDGAYGTRAERAAETAALHNSSEVDRLRSQVKKLKEELGGTAKDLEDITKEIIAAEREKLDAESKMDDALSVKVGLESEINGLRERIEEESQKSHQRIIKLQEDLDGERLKASPGPQGTRPGAGASVLSEQFRSTMREERKKFQEEIREERSRNRKLEEELARLKRAQGPGKSPLSPRQ